MVRRRDVVAYRSPPHLKLDQRISEMVGALRAITDNKVRGERDAHRDRTAQPHLNSGLP
jgi:hypothetical protein